MSEVSNTNFDKTSFSKKLSQNGSLDVEKKTISDLVRSESFDSSNGKIKSQLNSLSDYIGGKPVVAKNVSSDMIENQLKFLERAFSSMSEKISKNTSVISIKAEYASKIFMESAVKMGVSGSIKLVKVLNSIIKIGFLVKKRNKIALIGSDKYLKQKLKPKINSFHSKELKHLFLGNKNLCNDVRKAVIAMRVDRGSALSKHFEKEDLLTLLQNIKDYSLDQSEPVQQQLHFLSQELVESYSKAVEYSNHFPKRSISFESLNYNDLKKSLVSKSQLEKIQSQLIFVEKEKNNVDQVIKGLKEMSLQSNSSFFQKCMAKKALNDFQVAYGIKSSYRPWLTNFKTLNCRLIAMQIKESDPAFPNGQLAKMIRKGNTQGLLAIQQEKLQSTQGVVQNKENFLLLELAKDQVDKNSLAKGAIQKTVNSIRKETIKLLAHVASEVGSAGVSDLIEMGLPIDSLLEGVIETGNKSVSSLSTQLNYMYEGSEFMSSHLSSFSEAVGGSNIMQDLFHSNQRLQKYLNSSEHFQYFLTEVSLSSDELSKLFKDINNSLENVIDDFNQFVDSLELHKSDEIVVVSKKIITHLGKLKEYLLLDSLEDASHQLSLMSYELMNLHRKMNKDDNKVVLLDKANLFSENLDNLQQYFEQSMKFSAHYYNYKRLNKGDDHVVLSNELLTSATNAVNPPESKLVDMHRLMNKVAEFSLSESGIEPCSKSDYSNLPIDQKADVLFFSKLKVQEAYRIFKEEESKLDSPNFMSSFFKQLNRMSSSGSYAKGTRLYDLRKKYLDELKTVRYFEKEYKLSAYKLSRGSLQNKQILVGHGSVKDVLEKKYHYFLRETVSRLIDEDSKISGLPKDRIESYYNNLIDAYDNLCRSSSSSSSKTLPSKAFFSIKYKTREREFEKLWGAKSQFLRSKINYDNDERSSKNPAHVSETNVKKERGYELECDNALKQSFKGVSPYLERLNDKNVRICFKADIDQVFGETFSSGDQFIMNDFVYDVDVGLNRINLSVKGIHDVPQSHNQLCVLKGLNSYYNADEESTYTFNENQGTMTIIRKRTHPEFGTTTVTEEVKKIAKSKDELIEEKAKKTK